MSELAISMIKFQITTDKNVKGFTDAGRHDPLVVVRVHTHAVALQVKGKLTVFHVLEFILVQVRPSPQSRVYHVRKSFTTSNLKNIFTHKHSATVSTNQKSRIKQYMKRRKIIKTHIFVVFAHLTI